MLAFITGIIMLAIGVLWLIEPISGWFLGHAWPEVRIR
ncbi:MAG: hypothetical protein DDT31_00129 [Syntrophomonadaceae bacterium]|nr:hypothetical protein [Bacillota bacterium]MBT9137594.1 hypothetical protein [Bacillota bacterium]MBT9146831.1 hypothetical protein [Bacillota bacterium]